MALQAPRGTRDLLPPETGQWQYVETTMRTLCARYGFQELRTPIFEYTQLFDRGVGSDTDIVEKEMYTFQDRGGRSLSLRPEGTAGVVRAFVEHHLEEAGLPVKLYYLGPMFRYERPQAGRQRQFHQFGVEALGSEDPYLDAEVIDLGWAILQALKIDAIRLEINCIGCHLCRPAYEETLKIYLRNHRDQLCEDCQRRSETNPLRTFDCKRSSCQAVLAEAPRISDALCEACQQHFETLCSGLDILEIPYQKTATLVRGLDYYTRTVFEFKETLTSEAATVCGGGRYDHLVAEIGGKDQPGVGFGIGLERVMLLLEQTRRMPSTREPIDVYVVFASPQQQGAAFALVSQLRRQGIAAEIDHGRRSLKAQMRSAARKGVHLVLLLGEEEVAEKAVTLREMETGAQRRVSQPEVMQLLRQQLSSSNAAALQTRGTVHEI